MSNFIEPRMVHGPFETESTLRVLYQHLCDQILGHVAYFIPARQVELQNVFLGHSNSFLLVLMVKRQGPGEKRVDYAAKTPHVAREGIRLLVEDLRSNVS